MELEAAQQLAIQLMKEHNIRGWNFKWSKRLTKTYGQCIAEKKELQLSHDLTKKCSLEEVKDTVLHEIAHILVGVYQGHNKTWKRKCIKLGTSTSATFKQRTEVKQNEN